LVVLDISLFDRDDLSEFKIQFKKGINGDQTIYVDDVSLGIPNSYNSTGHAVTLTTATDVDVTHIYYSNLVDLPEDTSYTVQISLDDGTNWHTLLGSEFDLWVDISTWTEYPSFTDLKNIDVRIDLFSTDDQVTPLYDDYLLMWKLDV